MGSGIAYAAAMAGYDVVLFDVSVDALKRGAERVATFVAGGVERGKISQADAGEIRGRVRTTTDLEDFAHTVIAVEAVVERLEVKRELFSRLESIVSDSTVLATNTSSLAVTAIAATLDRPERVVGMHFFNPAHIMKLVEVIQGARTSDGVVARTVEICRRLGKSPASAKDTPGFIVNRVARNFYGEALRILGEGAATHDQIDRCLRAIGFRMGPFELMDLIGIDVNLAVTESVYAQYFQEPRFRPHLIQQKMVESGQLGRKSGGGFYREES